jgi:hypothetical protein
VAETSIRTPDPGMIQNLGMLLKESRSYLMVTAKPKTIEWAVSGTLKYRIFLHIG